MKKNHGLKTRIFFVPVIVVVVTMVFAGAIMAQRPAITWSPLARPRGFQAYDSESKQVGTIVQIAEAYRVIVAVDVKDISGSLRRIMMNLQTPNTDTTEAFGSHDAYFTTTDCTGQPYQEQYLPVTFPAISESHATTIYRDGKVEVWLPKAGEPPRPIEPVHGSSMERYGGCESYDFTGWQPDVVPLELVVTDFFSQFPPPYDVR